MNDDNCIVITIILAIIISFILGTLIGYFFSSHLNLECRNDGYYHVKFEDKNTNKEIWSRTNRKCRGKIKKETSESEFKSDW